MEVYAIQMRVGEHPEFVESFQQRQTDWVVFWGPPCLLQEPLDNARNDVVS